MNKYNLLDKVSPETTLKFVPGDRGYLQQNIDGVTGEAAVSQVKHSHSLASKVYVEKDESDLWIL